ncbi:hypothetical protein INR49_024018 [Caranx melampygus]|nr:hypothetical protein INR49_024018 [Caranx melampygus]
MIIIITIMIIIITISSSTVCCNGCDLIHQATSRPPASTDPEPPVYDHRGLGSLSGTPSKTTGRPTEEQPGWISSGYYDKEEKEECGTSDNLHRPTTYRLHGADTQPHSSLSPCRNDDQKYFTSLFSSFSLKFQFCLPFPTNIVDKRFLYVRLKEGKSFSDCGRETFQGTARGTAPKLWVDFELGLQRETMTEGKGGTEVVVVVCVCMVMRSGNHCPDL